MERVDGKNRKNHNFKEKRCQIKSQKDEGKEKRKEEMRMGLSLRLGYF